MGTVSDPLALEALRAAVKIIRTWHGARMLARTVERQGWALYYRYAPEMAPIRDALGPEGEELK